MTINLSVSVVLYKTDLNDLRACVDSLLKSVRYSGLNGLDITLKVDIINNFRNEGEINRLTNFLSIYKVAGINLINSDRNGGYGYGNNISIYSNKDSSDYHLVVNPDVIVDELFILSAITYMKADKSVGLLVPMIVNQRSEIQFLCKRNPTLLIMVIRSLGGQYFSKFFPKLNSNFLMLDHDYYREIRDVPYPSGCCLLFRMPILLEIGGFDERYFLHYEDADIGRKIRVHSLCVYRPEVIATHAWARETHKSIKMKLITILSGIKYLIKWGLQKEKS